MIDALYGSVRQIEESRLVLHTEFIDFELLISSLTAAHYQNLSDAERQNSIVYTFLQHREDAMILFGFRSLYERTIFQEIIKVQGIGPKQALKILSGITPADFIQALDSGNVGVLTSIPGLGTKTAQKMILALRDKLTLEESTGKEKSGSSKFGEVYRAMVKDIVQSLSDMGYDKRDARSVVETLLQESGEESPGLSISEREKKVFTAAMMQLG